MISPRSCIAFVAPLATAHNAPLAGQNQNTVKIRVTSSMTAGSASNVRNLKGVFHPATKPPNEHTNNATELGKK
jgi:hypothetical protein